MGGGRRFTLTISSETCSSFMNFIGTTAKASLISNRSICSICIFALASALRAAGIGPVSMMVGSAPESATDTMRARGVRPSCFPFSSEPISTAAAPSTIPEELPGVWTCLMRSTCG